MLSWSPDGAAIALCGADGARVIDPQTGEFVVASGLALVADSLSWSPESKYVVAADEHLARIWDPASGGIARALAQLVTSAQTGEVTIWDAQTGQGLKSARPFTTVPQYVSWSPSGEAIAACYNDGLVRLCDIQLQVQQELTGHYGACSPVCVCNWADGGATVLTADATAIRRWRVKTGMLQTTARHGLPSQATQELGWQFSPDNTRPVATGSAARVWNTATGVLQSSVVPLADGRPAVVSAEGHYLANNPLAENNLVYVVQTADGQELHSPKEFVGKNGWKNDPA